MRIDKYVWAIRLFKTRTLAGKMVKEGKILINNVVVKPGKEVNQNDVISVKQPPVPRTYKVIDFPKSRVGAKLVPNYVIETTSKEDLELIEAINLEKKTNAYLGIKGRPTKKSRRELIKTWLNKE